ncbi:hypothetical protein EYF80_059755 [Liparis tanakae]|uniref:Uncharacterized protein n=1 Tax=Liparis tanakae TaxID=230148 RepID=A0A4Z2EMI4_9TELE|nr:hypothetical protein EYF80_059755 [Liparis tanakae]
MAPLAAFPRRQTLTGRQLEPLAAAPPGQTLNFLSLARNGETSCNNWRLPPWFLLRDHLMGLDGASGTPPLHAASRFPQCTANITTKMADAMEEYEKEAGCVPILHPEVCSPDGASPRGHTRRRTSGRGARGLRVFESLVWRLRCPLQEQRGGGGGTVLTVLTVLTLAPSSPSSHG